MAYDSDNIFAKILRGEIPCDRVAENDQALAFNDISPQAPVHILVIPKGAYVSSDDFYSTAEPAEISGFHALVAQVARDAGLVESGYRLIANHGADGGQEVFHFHMHVMGGQPMGPMVVRR
ncbi:histidine triad nucleotide-binding protein [Magnetospira sp. QH-2]|uniref:histidine triad nucleotide-binding protein n=1 Tax=Magnetospira sp. (strain QH-2) TaxID=1288970 RepID=UPI0003E816B9|nr:histidine triad nucleotide-binding protein [Magnetospira sp. QH-2]CCQ75645.1 putative histidine triad nucleotide-binding protein like protein [Magnetospira sp. QH-2]